MSHLNATFPVLILLGIVKQVRNLQKIKITNTAAYIDELDI